MSTQRRLQVRIADIFGGAFRVWFAALPQLFCIAALAHAPRIALHLLAAGAAPNEAWRDGIERALPLLDLAASALTEACAVVLVLGRLRGERTALTWSLGAGTRRLATVLGITAILNAPNAASAVLDPLSLAASSARIRVDVATFAELRAWDVGIAVFIFLVGVFLCGPIAVAVAERRGVIASIGRSWLLTRGFRLTIAFAYLLVDLAWLLAIVSRNAVDLSVNGAVALLVDVAGELVVATFVCVVPTVIFQELREARESSDGEHFVEVFR